MDKKNSILIVDDDTSNLMELTHILSSEYKIHAVKDGASALEKADEYLPDLIIMDIVMPDMNGFEVFEKLKESDKTKAIPVIFITGNTESGDEIKGLACGAVDYLRKPFNDTIVKLRVLHHIQIINQLRMIEQLSMSDQLTNLPNRRSFEARINEEWNKANREKTPISVLILDIDHFKLYNDTYGHQQGDAALRAIAKIFTHVLRRPGDFVARWGGEEFIVLLSNTDLKGALEVAEHMRAAVEEAEIPGTDGLMTKITVSIGANTKMHDSEQQASNTERRYSGAMDEFISRADMALYDAKKKGRNRVCN
ncbi:MAG: diguanylate cyclase [Treponema sp.]|nr:diguanylate cyclase [Treponema sp.]